MKRMLDIIVSAALLLILSLFSIIITIIIRRRLGTPVLFKQERPGLHGQSFYLYKFRTMTDEVDEFGNLLPDEQRLTPLGKFLRKYSIDEWPQFFNVLNGDISLVGPRPLLMEYLPLYTKEQQRRHLVKPGITGWAQVNGRNTITWEEKFALDIWYVDHQSFWLDMKILWLTALKVIRSEGINQQGRVTVDRFRGSNSSVKEG